VFDGLGLGWKSKRLADDPGGAGVVSVVLLLELALPIVAVAVRTDLHAETKWEGEGGCCDPIKTDRSRAAA